MDGKILYYQGKLKGFKLVHAFVEQGCNEFAVFKQEVYVDQILRLSLYQCDKSDPFIFEKGTVNFDKKSDDKKILKAVEYVDKYNEREFLKPG